MMRHALVSAVAAFSLAGIGTAHAESPVCADPDGSTGVCRWTVEIDGRTELVPACEYEDGNVDGLPCLWSDPDTGVRFYVTSENYR